MIIDSSGSIVGRLAAYVAKSLLNGEKVIVVNSEKAVISGRKRDILRKYKTRREIKVKSTPEHAPKWPRRPDLLVRRIVRGMLPYDKPKGRKAFKNLKVYIGVPKDINIKEVKKIEELKLKGREEVRGKFITILKLCEELGWHA